METAVQFCFLHTTKCKSVLLSSAAQSYSLWENFEEKGEEYEKYIKKYGEV